MSKRSLIAKRMEDIPFQAIRSVGEEVARLEKQGKQIIHMEIGRPDFDTPAHIKQAAKEALDQGLVHYTSNYGIPELREAIADKLRIDNALEVDPATEVIVTVGTIEGILMALMATLDPGDEILIPDPAWTSYQHCIRMVGAYPISIPLKEENGFKPRVEDLEAVLTPRTKALLISSPHNPTGVILSQGELQQFADFAQQKDLVVLSDEIYEKLVYEGAKHYSIGSFPNMNERTITINGFSKAYSMTGWRLGYIAASKELVSAMIRVHQYCTVCATSFAQKGDVL
ncbi:MAG: pyridoxal phosphate-dependent aminotransferase, partial [Nitrospira sp.]|nr:pyridoxal phosphate-dependent aminotransferase [Nitrospira sp.]